MLPVKTCLFYRQKARYERKTQFIVDEGYNMLVHFKGECITNYILIESLTSTAVFKGSFKATFIFSI